MIVIDYYGNIIVETPESLDSLSIKELMDIACNDKGEYGRYALYVLISMVAGFDLTKPIYGYDIATWYLNDYDAMPEQQKLAYYAAMFDCN